LRPRRPEQAQWVNRSLGKTSPRSASALSKGRTAVANSWLEIDHRLLRFFYFQRSAPEKVRGFGYQRVRRSRREECGDLLGMPLLQGYCSLHFGNVDLANQRVGRLRRG